MLEACKKAHEEKADLYIKEDWRKMNKNLLINKYVEVEKNPALADAYVSAIIVRYWGALSKYYNSSYKVVDAQTCYEWLVSAILWALRAKKWLEPGNKLVGDPNGPDKVINRCIISVRLGFFQSSNTDKRRRNYGLESLDAVAEDVTRSASIPSSVDEGLDEGTLSIVQLIENAFDDKDYITAFLVDGIVNYDVFEYERDDEGRVSSCFSRKKLLRHLRALDYNYCKTFAKEYNKPIEEIDLATKECASLSRTRLKTAVNRSMRNLSKFYTKVLGEY